MAACHKAVLVGLPFVHGGVFVCISNHGTPNGGNVLAYDPHDTPLFVCLPLLAHLGACQYLLWCQDFFVVFSQIQAPPEYKPPIFEKNSLVGACIRECRVSNDPPEQRSSLPEPLVKHLRRSFASYLM